HLLGVSDDAANPYWYWKLDNVDGGGRARLESLANGALSSYRHYLTDKGRIDYLTTTMGNAVIQQLSYEWDSRLNMSSRSDWTQVKSGGTVQERFQYDAIDRL